MCLSGMAGHALYGMAPCFGHTGVTFDAENETWSRQPPRSFGGRSRLFFETDIYIYVAVASKHT